MYSEEILDRNLHPLHQGTIKGGATIQEILYNGSCGDELAVFLKLENDIITDVSWEGYACAISQASADLFADTIIGKKVADVKNLSWEDIPELASVKDMPARTKCAALPWQILHAFD